MHAYVIIIMSSHFCMVVCLSAPILILDVLVPVWRSHGRMFHFSVLLDVSGLTLSENYWKTNAKTNRKLTEN